MREMKDSGVEWIGEIPKDWKVSKAKYFYDCLDGKRVPIDSSQRENGQYPYWGAGSITDYVSNYLFDEELVLLGEDGAPFFDDTRPVAFLVSGKIWVNNHIHVLKVKKNFSARFLTHFLNIVDYGSYINGSILCKLTQSNMNSISIVYPILNKQERIASYLDSKCAQIDTIIERQQAVIEKLKEYKLSLITEAVTKGLNPDVPMKDSGVEWIGTIPEHWNLTKIGMVFDFIGGFAYNSELYCDKSDNQVLRIGNVKNGRLLLDSNPVYIDDEVAEDTRRFKVKEGSILFTMTGTKGKRDYFYTHLVTSKDVSKRNLFINQRVGCFIPKNGIDVGYYSYLLKDNHILDSIFAFETGTANQGNLGIDSIKRTILHMPPLVEQIAIREFLNNKCSAIDATISKKQALIEKLTAYKKSLIYEVVTGKKEV